MDDSNALLFTALNIIDYCYSASSYQVEARSRAILFEIGRPDMEADLQRSASMLSPTLGPPRTQSKEHVGLLRWPENSGRSRGPGNPSLAEIRNQPGSFSARALQVSMYGGMMDDMHPAQRRQPRHDHVEANQKHSVSYPEVPSRASNTRPLLSVKSAGPSVMNRKSAPAQAPAPVIAPFPPQAAGQVRRVVAEGDNSSDESEGEDVIVRVDSPGMLSFHPSSGPPQGN